MSGGGSGGRRPLSLQEEEIREEQYADPAEKKYPYEAWLGFSFTLAALSQSAHVCS